jgi:hypothetical protein
MELTSEEVRVHLRMLKYGIRRGGRKSTMMDDVADAEIEIETWEASDEVLEIAGSAGQDAHYTLGACTGLSVCGA